MHPGLYVVSQVSVAGREKLCVSGGEPVRVVLESDGTQVEDGEYFQTLPENTIFLVLRPGETWAPAGEDIVTQGKQRWIWSFEAQTNKIYIIYQTIMNHN